MKEQVILERNEYLKLKELADKAQQDIKDVEKKVKGTYLRELYSTIYCGFHDGFKSVPWGSESKDWTDADKEWSDTLKYLKYSIENGNYDNALCCLQSAIKKIVAENRKIVQKEGFLQFDLNKIEYFSKLPWYKKMFYNL